MTPDKIPLAIVYAGSSSSLCDLLIRHKEVPREASMGSYHVAISTSKPFIQLTVEAFHTVVSNAGALRALQKMLDHHSEELSLYGFTTEGMLNLPESSLTVNVFSWYEATRRARV